MRQRMALWMVCLLVLTSVAVAACGNRVGGREMNNPNSVEQVISNQMKGATEVTPLTTSAKTTTMDDARPSFSSATSSPTLPTDAEAVDYDLTEMSTDMAYATVAQMQMEPDPYIGKTFRMRGRYYTAFEEPSGTYFHGCIIQDEAACCGMIMEFVRGDDSRVFPENDPEINAEIIVEGTYETYRDENDDNQWYGRLANASLQVIGDGHPQP
ncbi:MAG: hypothetical protein ACOYH4_04595 [Saccharofermentanales bacterium]|jgi:hypothetical protein